MILVTSFWFVPAQNSAAAQHNVTGGEACRAQLSLLCSAVAPTVVRVTADGDGVRAAPGDMSFYSDTSTEDVTEELETLG